MRKYPQLKFLHNQIFCLTWLRDLARVSNGEATRLLNHQKSAS